MGGLRRGSRSGGCIRYQTLLSSENGVRGNKGILGAGREVRELKVQIKLIYKVVIVFFISYYVLAHERAFEKKHKSS